MSTARLPWRFALAIGAWWAALPLLYIFATSWNQYGTVGSLILVAERRGMPPLAVSAGLPLALGAAAALLVLVAAAVGRLLRVDPQGAAGEALAWGVRATGRRRGLILLALAVATPAIIGTKSIWSVAALLLAILALLATPFFASRRDTLDGAPAHWRPKRSWPGWAVLRLLVALFLIDWLLDRVIADLVQWPADHGVRLVLRIATAALSIWIGAWFAALTAGAWVEGSSGGPSLPRVAGQALRWRVIGPSLALQARWFGWGMFALLPLLLMQIYSIYDDAQLSVSARDAGHYWPNLYWFRDYCAFALFGLLWLALPAVLSANRLWVRLHPSEAVPPPAQG